MTVSVFTSISLHMHVHVTIMHAHGHARQALQMQAFYTIALSPELGTDALADDQVRLNSMAQ